MTAVQWGVRSGVVSSPNPRTASHLVPTVLSLPPPSSQPHFFSATGVRFSHSSYLVLAPAELAVVLPSLSISCYEPLSLECNAVLFDRRCGNPIKVGLFRLYRSGSWLRTTLLPGPRMIRWLVCLLAWDAEAKERVLVAEKTLQRTEGATGLLLMASTRQQVCRIQFQFQIRFCCCWKEAVGDGSKVGCGVVSGRIDVIFATSRR